MFGIIFGDSFDLKLVPRTGIGRSTGSHRVATLMRTRGVNVEVVDFFNSWTDNELVALLNKFPKIDFIGFGLGLSILDRDKINLLISNARKLHPAIKVIAGGSNVLDNQYIGIDLFFKGFTEGAIDDIIEYLKTGEYGLLPVETIETHGVKEVVNCTHHYEKFDLSLLNTEYLDSDYIHPNEALPIEFSRGCIFKCKFCNYPLLGKNPNDMSYFKKEENLLRELTTNYEKFKTLHYFVLDDTFNERTDKIEMMLRIRDKSKLDLSFVGFNRIELLARKKEQIPLLKDLNFIGFHFGLESLNFPSAKSIGKGIQLTEILSTIDRLRTVYDDKLAITSNILIGLPHETRDTINAAIPMYSDELAGIDRVTFSGLVITNQTHGESEFFKNPEKYGYNILPENDGSWTSEHWSSKECEQLAKKLEDKLKYSKRTRLGPFMATGLQSLGFDFLSAAKHTFMGFPWQTVNERAKQFRANYLNNLKSL